MKQGKKAVFDFENYKISKFSFTEIPKDNLNPITLEFSPSGKFYSEKKRFEIDIIFVASLDLDDGERGEEIINVNLNAAFKFTETIEFSDIPTYFYRNALAIVFPFLRAFISTLTFQANIKPVILPILNLSSLEQHFKDNTEEIKEQK